MFLNSPEIDDHIGSSVVEFVFNVTDASSTSLNCSLYIDNVFNQSNISTPVDTRTLFSVTLAEKINYTWNISCFNENNIEGQDSRIFTIDLTKPTILWTVPADDNQSIFNTTFTQNVTFNDAFLFNYECVIYNQSSLTTAVWTITREISGNTTYTKTDSVSVSNLTDGIYYERCQVSDRE